MSIRENVSLEFNKLYNDLNLRNIIFKLQLKFLDYLNVKNIA